MIDSIKYRYHVLCNKYNTLPLQDIEDDLSDKVENGNTLLLIDSNRRMIDAQQCAAIVEILRWDLYYYCFFVMHRWFNELSIHQIQGRDDIIPALAQVIEKNTRLTTIQLDSIKTQPRVLLFSFSYNRHFLLSLILLLLIEIIQFNLFRLTVFHLLMK